MAQPGIKFPTLLPLPTQCQNRQEQPDLDLELRTLTQFTGLASLFLHFFLTHLPTQPTFMEGFIYDTPGIIIQAPEDQERIRHNSTILRIYRLW